MSLSFSTDLVPVSDRLEAWLCNAKPICGDCRFHFPRRLPFHGAIERRTLAGLDLTRFASSPVSFAKFPMVAGDSEDRGCIAITQVEGMRQYCQRGATLFSLATSLYEQAERMNIEDGLIAIEAYLDILAGCIARPESAATKLGCCAQLRPRVEYFIETHLHDPDLSPAGIADAGGISVRHLHRLFAAKGCTVAEWVRERRLERCRTDLSDPHLREKNITDIAFGWGFSDSAHFSHCFKKEFGVSPRQFRTNASSWNLPRVSSSPTNPAGSELTNS